MLKYLQSSCDCVSAYGAFHFHKVKLCQSKRFNLNISQSINDQSNEKHTVEVKFNLEEQKHIEYIMDKVEDVESDIQSPQFLMLNSSPLVRRGQSCTANSKLVTVHFLTFLFLVHRSRCKDAGVSIFERSNPDLF